MYCLSFPNPTPVCFCQWDVGIKTKVTFNIIFKSCFIDYFFFEKTFSTLNMAEKEGDEEMVRLNFNIFNFNIFTPPNYLPE